MGLARLISNALRFSLANDSGKMKYPYKKFNKHKIAAA